MTKKRFGYGADVNWQGDIIIDYETEKSYDFYEVRDLLNELTEENEKIKQQLRIHKDDYLETLNDLERAYKNNEKALNNIERLEEEKEKLKSLCKVLITHIEKESIAFVIDKDVRRLLE